MGLVVVVRCDHCGDHRLVDADGAFQWLRLLGRVRSEQAWEAEIVFEVFRGTADGLSCRACGRRGLFVGLPHDENEDWPEARPCQECGRPIPPERLEALPEALRCVDCQQKIDRGDDPAAAEYCPKCGSPMILRLSRGGGITRHTMRCGKVPPCRLH